MRAQYPFTALLSAAALLAACETNTSPDMPPPNDGQVSVLTVTPSYTPIDDEQPGKPGKPGSHPCAGKC